MSLKNYVRIWLFLSLALAFEAFALNFNSFISGWALLKENLPAFKHLNLSPEPGKTISLWYGWTGMGLMLLTNLYILRKHWAPLKKLGRLPDWLDFHIFCGLLGPVFILFHTNFKVGGLVAISFWSMVISFSSGIVGRYFYMQLVGQRVDLENECARSEQIIQQEMGRNAPEGQTRLLMRSALKLAGANEDDRNTGLVRAIARSVAGDFRLSWGLGQISPGTTPLARASLKTYARNQRRIGYLSQFQRVMGYWHSFHMPFAVFMYVVAAIHIAVALLLQVKN